MEDHLMDELYGDLDDKPSGTYVQHDEDSMDIYSGLENSPKSYGHRGKVNPFLSPCTMESMDMYEEIIREEQEEKEATYSELKQKFDEAQNQVKELFSKLQLLQTKNSSLNTENTLLKKNICSLIKTARMEIVRKDEEISRLSNRFGRGSYGQNFRRSEMESGQTNSRHCLINATSSLSESRECGQDKVIKEVHQHKRNTVPGHCAFPAATSAVASQSFEVLLRCPRTDLESPLPCQKKNDSAISDSKTVTVQPEHEVGHVHPNKTSGSIKDHTTSTVTNVSNSHKSYNSRSNVADTNSDSGISSLEDNKNYSSKRVDKPEKSQKRKNHDKECNSQEMDLLQRSQNRVDGNLSQSGRTERQLTKDSCMYIENKNQQPEVPVILRSSERSKSPSFQSHKTLPSEVSSQSSKSSVKTAADMETQGQEYMHNQFQDRTSSGTRQSGWRSTACAVVDDASHSQNHKMEKRNASGHQRREEKSQRESSSAERRSARTERCREHELKKQKDSDRSKKHQGNRCSRERSNRSDGNKEYKRRSAKEADYKHKRCREWRSRKQVDASDSRHAISSPKCDSKRKDICKGRASGRIEEPLLNSKKSHSHENSRKMEDSICPVKNASAEKDYSRGKGVGKDRKRKEEERMVQKDGKSKNVALTKGDIKNHSPVKHKIVREGKHSKNVQDTHLESVHTQSPSTLAISKGPCKSNEDNSADRKLTFMETLNLTLSPLKKQRPPSDPMEPTGATSEEASPDNSRLSEFGKDFIVIDQLKNSQNSIEEKDKDPEQTNAIEQLDLTSSCKQSEQVDYLFTAVFSEKPSDEETNIKVQEENVPESHEAVDKEPAIFSTSEKEIGNTIDFNVSDNGSLSNLNLERESPSSICQNCTEDSPGIIENIVVSNALPTKISELTVLDNTPDSIVDDHQQKVPFSTVSEEISQKRIQRHSQPKSQDLIPAQNGICLEDMFTDKARSIPVSNSGTTESSVTMEVSLSNNSANLDDQSKVICNVEVGTSRQYNEKAGDAFESQNFFEISQASENMKTSEIKLSDHDTTAPSDTTVREEAMSSVQGGSSEPDSTDKEKQILKPSSPLVFPHDEDSMMLTLRNLRVIPEPISPLTSPVRQVKNVQPQRADKQPHVKSLSKDLSTTTSGGDKDSVNMDMNKENESPDSSVTPTSHKGTKDGLSASGTEQEELEDGEIVSESEEEGPLFIQTPPREQDKSTSGTHPSPRINAGGKRVSQKKSKVPTKSAEQTKSPMTAAADGSPTSSKRRFKTVSPPLKAAVHTLDEFMGMLATIRVELRKKYMKLHRNVTKTAFCCIVDMSHASFTEFIDSVDLDKLGCQGNDIKVRLNEIISSIMSKVTKNGIVNRIFEQRAGDLKQKLWTFVNGQFDFLFKELKAALKNGSEPSVNACSSEHKSTTLKGKGFESEVKKELFSTSVHRVRKAKVDTGNCGKEAPTNNLPHRGLGSRGKNIKASMTEDDQPAKMTLQQLPSSSSENSASESTSGSENKISSYVRRLSHNGSAQDRSDFEILTEQQASSLTFNLVSDSQMGEIFKCLLQGSDLLDPSIPVGDNQSWPVSTPRKEGLPGESLIGIMTPNKTTPSKFITSWSSISPYKFASNSKMLVDPAILDESCLLEVPSNSEPSQVPFQSSVISQRSFSILAEDLAVSLTIPSPLKSDSHLSFLHPGTGQPLSAPNSVLSAHYSEDALLDGEDATEQDIHLSLDTDNSSCGSSPSRTWEGSDPCGFQFKPNLPMQAEVMERSNDHFIVRIRHTSTTSPIECNQNEGKREPALDEGPEPSLEPNLSLTTHNDIGSASGETDKSPAKATVLCDISDKGIEARPSSRISPSEGVCNDSLFGLSNVQHVSKEACVTVLEASSATEPETTEKVSGNARSTTRSQSAPEAGTEGVSRKRKGHHSEPKAKHSKMEKSQDKRHKSRHKKRSKLPKEKGSKTAVTQVSPSSLSAKNVIRKKGEVVVTWTRDEDRDILIELKMKGASPKTFAVLSKKLKKSTEQIEERFTQLMKLFKKKEKMIN
ncbi:CASP8-associated protein 2 [Myxocyprinus asiaticus]|uniref:CASP8-associated protein 2 n=1 Tax=Myxocyprinus asiaticus TaxID=70543 RepID=UPI00222171F8|nr:CASP8-associated protein 2 [Myxocyprinus asiaticus]XP_051581148.1 CASP8-associated protein 2 [Myxocyprinus asiaticus]